MNLKFLISLILIFGLLIACNQPEQNTSAPAPDLKEQLKNYNPRDIDSTAPVQKISLSTIGNTIEELKQTPERTIVKSGSTIQLMFHNRSVAFQNNVVLVVPGYEDSIAQSGLKAFPGEGFLATGMLGLVMNGPMIPHGDSIQINFKAPPKGMYHFMCTYPGHYKHEQSILIVE